jgi:6-phospho-beta-glucosidase
MLKVTVIGGGSTYTPELVKGFLDRVESFPLTELCLMDVDEKRLSIVGGFAQRMALAYNAPFKVTLTANRRTAVTGASYVTTQLRVGQMPARREDEYLGKRHGLIGQETTGIGGMAKALRTIPVILALAAEMREVSPGALLVNFTNPAGLVTQALSMFAPDVPAVGVCNVAITTKMHMVETLSEKLGKPISPNQCELNTLGLNHLTWHRGLKIDGEEMWNRVLTGYIEELKKEESPEYPPELIATLGMIPNYYLQYFYGTQHKLEEQNNWPPSRAEEVMEVEHTLLGQYADPSLTEPAADLMKRGGAYYSTVATQLLNAHFNDLGETHVVNIKHGGAVKGWPSDWVLEMPCKVNHNGIQPFPANPLPETCFGLIAQVKSYELLTARAAVTGDRSLLYQAMLAHPLGPQANKIQEVMEDLLTTHKQYLPAFWKNG